MIVVQLPKSDAYQPLYTLSGYSVSDSLIITNDTPQTIFLTQSDTQPTDDSNAFFAHPYQTVLAHADGKPLWVRGKPGPILVQLLSRTITPFTAVEFPHDTMTSDLEGFRRLRVDLGQTGFFEGREARSFWEFSIHSGTSQYIKVNVPVNTILMSVDVTVDAGGLRVSTLAGATDGKAFTGSLPIVPKNTMTSRRTPFYVPQNTLQTGGTAVGGTVIDIVRLVTSGSTAQKSSIGGAIADERGVTPGIYYWKFENISNSTTTGTFHTVWEERP